MNVHLRARVRWGRASVASGTLAVLGVLGVLLTGCGGSGPAPAAVPSLSQGSNGTQATDSAHATKLHAAAACIRQHGIPGYADPVLTAGGAVYSDLRPIQDASDATLAAVQAACRTLMAEAGLNPENEPPAPPQLVEAGVRAAECERLHGLPSMQDPTSRSPYTPGHGFGITGNEIPPGGKASHGFQEAIHACQSQDSAEIQASTLSSLGRDG